MKAKVEIVYEDTTKNKKVEIDIPSKFKGVKVLDKIDDAVNEQFKDDKDWKRWNLLGITDEADPPPASRARQPKAKKSTKKK
jgi:hypothetical protein